MAEKGLFGGAIAVQLPKKLVDVSDLRQVPDNQEVFLYPHPSNVTIVIEILERIPEQIDVEALKFHFDALAHDNDAIASTMLEPPSVIHNDRGDQTPSPIVMHGLQRIRKLNSVIADDVDIFFALFRVSSGRKNADLVVSASIPRTTQEGDIEHQRLAAVAESDFNTLISSLRILDYGLFSSNTIRV